MTVDVIISGGTAPWVIWEPLSTGDLLTAGLTAVLGVLALTLAAFGLWQMRTASVARNRQLDAMLRMLDERTATLIDGMRIVTHGLETVIRQTGRETP